MKLKATTLQTVEINEETDIISYNENVLFCAASHLNALYGAATSSKACG